MPRLLSFILVFLFPFLVFGQTLDIKYLAEKLDYFPEAQRFEATYKDLKLQGIELGPEDGIPLVFVGGFTSNLPVYRKLLREFADRGFRVFNYNPPGQGAGSLVSMGEDPRWQSFGGLVKALELMHRTVYTMTGQKVLVSGHSLGGMQSRMFSLGLKGLLSDQLKVSPKKQQEVIDNTIGIVPIFSPSLTHMASRYDDNSFKGLIMAISEYAMKKVIPWTMETYYALVDKTPWLAKTYLKFLEYVFVRPFDPWNEFWTKVYTGRSMDFKEMRKVIPLSSSEFIYPEIVESLKGWSERAGAISRNGFDIGQAWIDKQNSDFALPVLQVVAERDLLAPKEELLEEVEWTNSPSILLKGGHIDPLFDREQVPMIVDEIMELFGLNCEALFKAS